MSKRVCCLYRVSTKGQVEKDDIPMQKQVCHEFAEAHGWNIISEHSEKGVSGFKVSAKDRDEIQEIQREAESGSFDILLVFMFDRLGRREDETPFVVEWFVKNGIEVWSAVEGQQRFDNHVDKLMNYIRYWQASGESLKTSVRTKTRLGQIVQEGRFRGGFAPYGYQLVKKGRIGKKNKELYDIEICPDEAIVVRKIFEKAANYGYGARRIASDLKAEGIYNRSGEIFHYSSIQNILKNIMYMGILRSGETRSDIFPELQIIDEAVFKRVNDIRAQRTNHYEKQRTAPRKVTGKALLSGNIYCGHCGGRLFATTAPKSHHPTTGDSPQERIPVYKCYNRTQHIDKCDGQTTYRAEKIDAAVESILNSIFSRVNSSKGCDFVQKQYEAKMTEYRVRLNHSTSEHTKSVKELSKLDSLMMDALTGNCVFSPEDLKRRMQAVKSNIDEFETEIDCIKDEMNDTEAISKRIQEEYRQLISWAKVFDESSTDVKKMIASYMISKVTVSRDYNVDVELNLTEQEFMGGFKMEM